MTDIDNNIVFLNIQDYTAATSLISSLLHSQPSTYANSPSSNPSLRSALARVYLLAGDLASSQEHFALVEADPDADSALKKVNNVVWAAAKGEWERAEEIGRDVLGDLSGSEGTGVGTGEDVVVCAVRSTIKFLITDISVGRYPYKAANNFAVALLARGKVKEAISTLEHTLSASPTACTTTEPFLFNLATLYELRAALAGHAKLGLLVETSKWGGDGIRVGALKMGS